MSVVGPITKSLVVAIFMTSAASLLRTTRCENSRPSLKRPPGLSPPVCIGSPRHGATTDHVEAAAGEGMVEACSHCGEAGRAGSEVAATSAWRALAICIRRCSLAATDEVGAAVGGEGMVRDRASVQ
jgi:hypothetical protein